MIYWPAHSCAFLVRADPCGSHKPESWQHAGTLWSTEWSVRLAASFHMSSFVEKWWADKQKCSCDTGSNFGWNVVPRRSQESHVSHLSHHVTALLPCSEALKRLMLVSIWRKLKTTSAAVSVRMPKSPSLWSLAFWAVARRRYWTGSCKEQHGKRLAVIENEFGEVGIET